MRGDRAVLCDPAAAGLGALPREVRTFQVFVRRSRLEGMRTQERNRLAAEPGDAVIRASIQHVIDLLDDEMATLRARIHDHFDQHPDLRAQRDLLTSIPGIGEATAAVLLAEFGPLTRFRQAPACAAFAGLVPRHGVSGSSVRRKPVLSKLGAPALRKALFYPAMVALRHNPIIAAFGQRLRAKGKHKMVVIAAAMRKLAHLAFGVIKTGQPFNSITWSGVDFQRGLFVLNRELEFRQLSSLRSLRTLR